MSVTWSRFLPWFLRTRVEDSQHLQAIIGNIGWLLLDKVVRMGVGLFVGVWVARYLGPEQFGTLNYAMAFTALFGTLAGLGLDGIVIRDLVRQPKSRGEILGSALVLKLAAGLATLGLTLVAIFLVRPQDPLARWLVGILAASTVFKALDAIDLWFQSQVQSRYTVWARNSAFGVVALTKIVLILTQAPLIAFAWVMLGEMILGSLGLALAYRLAGHSVKEWQFNWQRASRLLRESWPLIFSGLMIMLYMRIDQIMLGQMVGDKAVGIFAAAVRVSEIWYFIPIIFASSVFPAIVRSKEQGEEVYRRRLQHFFDINALLAYGLSIPFSLLSPVIISMLYGKSFAAAAPIFAIHIWTCLFVFTGVARGQYLVTESLLKFSLFATFLGALVNIGLNLFLIPRYQGLGSAIATLVTQFISAYLSSFFLPQLIRTGWMQTQSFIAPMRFLYKWCIA